ncbi:UNVERIFIED_CONTAM: hypothetical protein GTU68_017028 [Idotea baltica]|nr:hypothetical protein [Idotea baltica]
MRYLFRTFTAFVLFLSSNAYAASPSVAVDIAPLHSLVSQVMEGVGQPKLLMPAGASPHHYTLKPSEAKALESADVVFWVGERLSPWLGKALKNLASEAQNIEMLEIDGTTIYMSREGATFESHDHDDEHSDEHDDDHDEKKGHKEKGHKDDEHEDEHHKDEHHDKTDPHAWLDPENAKLWVKYIGETLSKQDPDNASIYSENVTKATASLDALIKSTDTQIKALGNPQFIVFHDAYQYFEKRFGISAAGSIKLGDAADPSPARIKEVQAIVKKLGVTCVFSEPQYNPAIVKTVFEGTSVSTIGVMDPLGQSLAVGSGQYQQLIEAMVKSLSQCK